MQIGTMKIPDFLSDIPILEYIEGLYYYCRFHDISVRGEMGLYGSKNDSTKFWEMFRINFNDAVSTCTLGIYVHNNAYKGFKVWFNESQLSTDDFDEEFIKDRFRQHILEWQV